MSPETQTSPKKSAQDKPECSVLFVFYNGEHHAEQMLTPFLELEEELAELIIINDGSSDDTHSVIESLLTHYQRDRAYYHQHDFRKGTGQCLNIAVSEAASETILIADKTVELQPSAFRELIRMLGRSNDAYTVPVNNPALQPVTLSRHLEQQKIPASVNYIFRTDRIRTDRMFFNPFIQTGHSAELLLRAGASAGFMEAPAFFTMPYPQESYSDLSVHDSELILLQARHHAKEIFSDSDDDADVDQRYEKAFALKVDGRITEALQLCDEILKKHPRHDNTVELKIELLQRLKRFVKASELKHSQNQEKQRSKQIDSDAAQETSESGPEESASEPEPGEPDLFTEVTGEKPEAEAEEQAANRASDSGDSPEEPETKKAEASPEQPSESKPETEAKVEAETEPETDSKSEEDDPEPETYERPEKFRHSIVVPVAGMGLPFLENLMVCLHEFGTPEDTELIVVDNACIDDTYTYLRQLSENHFFHIRVIQHEQNTGFAASANKGIEAAEGDFIIVMHSDVSPDSNIAADLADVLEAHPQAGITGPVTDRGMNEEQLITQQKDPKAVSEISYLESICIAMRKSDGFRFDTSYAPAWFEDMDLSMQVKQAGKKVLLAEGVFLRHYLGGTTDQLGLGPESSTFYINQKQFNEKWEVGAEIPESKPDMHPLEQVFQIGKVVNPLHPFDEHFELLKTLFTDEVQAELSEFRDLSDNALICFIRAMMAIDNRFMMRNLEEQLSGPLDEETGLELVQYYYDRNIYSRCRKHLAGIKGDVTPARKLFELRIAWGEKDLEAASEHLDDMLAHFPAHPEVNRIAGEMHQLKGNKTDSESFFSIAAQADPFRFPWPEPEPDFDEEAG